MIRQRIFGAFFAHILLGQIFTVLDVAGLTWRAPFVVVVSTSTVAVLLGFSLWKFTPRGSSDVTALSWLGPLAWGLWASLYYLVAARSVTPHALPDWYMTRFEPRVVLAPSAVLIYISVHPLSVLPYFSLASPTEIRRHFSGQLAIVAVSVLCWLAYPLSHPRHEPFVSNGSIGTWALSTLQRHDPVVNCLPSTHCAVALYAALALRKVDARLGVWALMTAFAISVSTLLTAQHYLLDVVAGLGLGFVASRFFHRS